MGCPGAWQCGWGSRRIGSIMTHHALHACAPPTGTPICHAPRPKAQGGWAEHSWCASTCAPSCSSGDIPSPTAKGSGPLWGLMWCDGGVWPWVSLSKRKAPVASPHPPPQGVLPGLLCLRNAEGAKTMPLWAVGEDNGRGGSRHTLPLALPHGSARGATSRKRAARGGRVRRDLSHNERPWGLSTHGAPCQRRAVRH